MSGGCGAGSSNTRAAAARRAAAPATSSTLAVRTGSPLTCRRRRGGAAEALDDQNDADLFNTWGDALNDAAVGECVSPCGVSPLVVFPPVVCGGCAPLRSSDPLVALLLWVRHSSLRASGRQTWAGSSLANTGAPQLHALAPLQQRRWPARRPAHVSYYSALYSVPLYGASPPSCV